jgi:hypothetical protein
MMVPIILVIFLLIAILFLIRRGVNLDAQEVVLNYLNAIVRGRPEEAYHYLSSKNKVRQTLQEFQERLSLGNGLIANLIARNISFTVEKTDLVDDTATVGSAITTPDFKLIMADVLRKMAPDRIPEQNLESFIFICRNISHYLDKYQQDTIPLKTCTESFHLIREKDGWRICLEGSD